MREESIKQKLGELDSGQDAGLDTRNSLLPLVPDLENT